MKELWRIHKLKCMGKLFTSILIGNSGIANMANLIGMKYTLEKLVATTEELKIGCTRIKRINTGCY